MTEVLSHKQIDLSLPIDRVDAINSDEDPQPPKLHIEPIHALQLGIVPFFVFYLFMSIIIAIVSRDYYLLIINVIALIIPIAGRLIERYIIKNPIKCRKVAISVLIIEFGLFFIWQITCTLLFR